MASLNSRDSQLPRPSSSSSTSSLSSYTKLGSTSDEEPKRDIQKNNNGSCSYNTQNPCRNAGSLTVGGLLSGVHDSNSVTGSFSLVDAEVSLIDPRNPTRLISTPGSAAMDWKSNVAFTGSRTVDDLWREIVVGNRKELKEEVLEEMITLEDFLQAKAQEVDGEDIKFPLTERLSGGVVPFDLNPLSSFQALDGVEGAIVGFGNGAEMTGYGREGRRGKRRRAALEPLDEAAQQRQRRMIKNRESAARSRERKQAYQIELESLAARLEEENERLLKEKAERAKERLKQLMEKVIPVVEKRRPSRVLCRGHSFEW